MKKLQEKLRTFAKERDWEQFHSPKNLSMALAVETSELMEHFQWLSEAQSLQLDTKTNDAVALELADVFLYTLLLADKLNIDLYEQAQKKMAINASKYPEEKAKGSAKKYTEYQR
ncbi:MAG: dCTP diphosphatase [Lentisphaeria bacterium]